MTPGRQDQIEIAKRNIANGIPDSRWCGDASCDLNGMEHGHGRFRHPVFARSDMATGKDIAKLVIGVVLALAVPAFPFGVAMCSLDHGCNTYGTLSAGYAVALLVACSALFATGGWMAMSTLWKAGR